MTSPDESVGPDPEPGVLRFVAHSHTVLRMASRFGWLPGARYTNLRDVRRFSRLGFLDIEWESYSFRRHLAAARATRPLLTVARDITDHKELPRTLDEARALREYSGQVIVVPKDPRLADGLEERIPAPFLLGYSVPSRYGQTSIPLEAFSRPVHLLGGRPDVQRSLANRLDVVSLDCNRFTIDAMYGDFFDGETFRPHPVGGYERCVQDSLRNINSLWDGYAASSRGQTIVHAITRFAG